VLTVGDDGGKRCEAKPTKKKKKKKKNGFLKIEHNAMSQID
jgi:hypothetical protein